MVSCKLARLTSPLGVAKEANRLPSAHGFDPALAPQDQGTISNQLGPQRMTRSIICFLHCDKVPISALNEKKLGVNALFSSLVKSSAF